MTVGVVTDSSWPERFRLDVRGQSVWLTKAETIQAIAYLTNALYSPGQPQSKPVRIYQLYEAKP